MKIKMLYRYDSLNWLTNQVWRMLLITLALFAVPEVSTARYLNVDTGRFWTMDTYEGDNEDPLSLHKYLYAQDNPVDHTDSSGHQMDDLAISMDIDAGLDALYNGSVIAAGNALQSTLLGVQAGETANAILENYLTETVVGTIVGYGAFKVLGKAFDIEPSASTAAEEESDLFDVPSTPPPNGTQVYRVYVPGKTDDFGKYWTTVDPRIVANYSDTAGLPAGVAKAIQSGEAKIITATIKDNTGITASVAKSSAKFQPPGEPVNAGGLYQLEIDNAVSKVARVKPDESFGQYWGY